MMITMMMTMMMMMISVSNHVVVLAILPTDWAKVDMYYRGSNLSIHEIVHAMIPSQYIVENERFVLILFFYSRLLKLYFDLCCLSTCYQREVLEMRLQFEATFVTIRDMCCPLM